MEISKAIQSLKPNVSFSMEGDNIVTWESDLAQPTTSEINAEIIVLQAAYDALEYSRLRKAKYDLLNQDEMRYDDLVNNTTTWRDGIAAIKAAHPKP
jgi:hypothetical protein